MNLTFTTAQCWCSSPSFRMGKGTVVYAGEVHDMRYS